MHEAVNVGFLVAIDNIPHVDWGTSTVRVLNQGTHVDTTGATDKRCHIQTYEGAQHLVQAVVALARNWVLACTLFAMLG